jgi:hypothetical protein
MVPGDSDRELKPIWSNLRPELFTFKRFTRMSGDGDRMIPGFTWTVAYRWNGAETEHLQVRAFSAEGALREAHYSLETGELGYEIMGLMREDQAPAS